MSKRKATAPATGVGRRSKRSKTTTNQAFVWNPREWKQTRRVTGNVSVLVKVNDCNRKVVKVLEVGDNLADDPFPLEIRAITMLPECNRIVRPIHYASDDPDEEHGTVFFEYYLLGDVRQWKEAGFDTKNNKPVPESHIWRFFLQMSQAVAVLQNQIVPDQEGRETLLHRDIKPNNILVVHNGMTYPSFALHDFGCAATYMKLRAHRRVICGTMEWQPPENPIINTKAAEIWALGACVHYLVTGSYPIEGMSHTVLNASRRMIAIQRPCKGTSHLNVTTLLVCHVREQQKQRIRPYLIDGQALFNHQYSDELDGWMKKCLMTVPAGRPTVKQLLNSMGPVAISMLKKMVGKAALNDLDAKFNEDL